MRTQGLSTTSPEELGEKGGEIRLSDRSCRDRCDADHSGPGGGGGLSAPGAPGFPGSSHSKASACNAGDLGSIPESGRSPGEGNGNPFQYSCLENPMDGGTWQAVVHRVTKSQNTIEMT